MTIQKLQSDAQGVVGNMTGTDIATSVNGLINAVNPPNITRPFAIATLGDSITDTNNGVKWDDAGYPAWLRRSIKAPYTIDGEDNIAVGGTATELLLSTQLPLLIASGCGFAITMCGINDIRNDRGSDFIIANLITFYTVLEANGIIGIALSLLPTDTGSNLLTDAQAKAASRVNLFLLNLSKTRRDVYYFSMLDEVTDYATGLMISAQMRDSIHPNKVGGLVQATKIASEFNNTFGGSDGQTDIYGNLYDATLNPNGNIFVNSYMRGTGGEAANGTTGVVSDNHRVRMDDSSATFDVVASLEVIGNKTYQVMTLSGTGDGTEVSFSKENFFSDLPADWVEGDTIECKCEIIYTGIVGIDAAFLKMGAFGTTSNDGSEDASSGTMPTDFSGNYRAKGVIQANATQVYGAIAVKTTNGVAVGGAIKITNVTITKL